MAAFYQVRPPTSLLVDPLCCQEEDPFPFWEEEVEDPHHHQHHPSAAAEEAQWDWDEGGGDEEGVELAALLSKQVEAHSAKPASPGYLDADPSLSRVRLDAVGWVLKACARHGFTAQTALLAVDYLDRFLSSTRCGGGGGAQQQQQPWMAQLSAVACLSLAAKMEETHVPLLLDLQVEEARYVFEARTVQRMELLVLSTLGWRMGPPTPLSFIDHFLRRRSAAAGTPRPPLSSSPSRFITYNSITMNNKDAQQQQQQHLHWKFQARCHSILLALVADSRWVQFLPSVLAAATMLHALGQLRDHRSSASSAMDLQSSLVNLLAVTKDQLQACTVFILDATGEGGGGHGGAAGNKRKQSHISSPLLPPPSPRGVADATFSYDSDNGSWPASASTSVSSSPDVLPARALKRLHSIATSGGEEGRCCQQPLRDGVFV